MVSYEIDDRKEKIMNTINKLKTLTAICAALIITAKSNAQAPLYAGYEGSKYALESRIDNSASAFLDWPSSDYLC